MFELVSQTLFWLFIICSISSILFTTLKNGISPMPTNRRVAGRISTVIRPFIHESTVIYDLGSGWGTLVHLLAKRYSQTTIIGVENSPLPYLVSKFRIIGSSRKNVELVYQDLYKTELLPNCIIICYLYPGAMEKLKQKFVDELPSGTIVISQTFEIRGWQPIKVIKIHDFYQTKIFVYSI